MDILITEDLHPAGLERLAKQFHVVHEGAIWKDSARLKKAIGEARAILVRNQTQVTAELLGAAPKLIGIGRLGVGLDNIDLEMASKLGVVVIAPLDANATSVAEFTLGLMMALARKVPRADRTTKAGGWDRKGCVGMELHGKTLAICGFGRIGRLVAARARAFGMRVLAYDPYLKADSRALIEAGARLCEQLEEALAEADVVSAHSPLTTRTRRMFEQRVFNLMNPGALFINTSRGGIVDETALLEALRSGHLRGAALDVREVEPPVARSAFEELENVILTPHIGSFTREAQARTFEAVAADLERLLHGAPAVNFVNFAAPRPRTV